jgi:TonB family protein
MSNTSLATRVAAGALALAATFGTVSTVHAKTDADFRRAVETSIDHELHAASVKMGNRSGVATLAIAVDPQGAVRSIDLVKSSGHPGFDKDAIAIAHRVGYPASGKARTVAMVLGFNRQVDVNAQAKGQRLVQTWLENQRVMLADTTQNTTARQPDS